MSAPNEWIRRLGGRIRHAISLLFSVALTFFGLTCVTFSIGGIVPIDPVRAIVGDKASRATYDRLAVAIGVNLPMPVQYWRYLKNVATIAGIPIFIVSLGFNLLGDGLRDASDSRTG